MCVCGGGGGGGGVCSLCSFVLWTLIISDPIYERPAAKLGEIAAGVKRRIVLVYKTVFPVPDPWLAIRVDPVLLLYLPTYVLRKKKKLSYLDEGKFLKTCQWRINTNTFKSLILFNFIHRKER